MNEPKNLFRIFTVAGQKFHIYYEYYEQMKKSYPSYPDFVNNPEYTENGYAFVHFIQECCPYGATKDNSYEIPDNCGMCKWFKWEKPDIPIGVCMNQNLKLADKSVKRKPEYKKDL